MTTGDSLPLRSYPGMNRFVLDRLGGDDAALALLPNVPPRSEPRSVDPALAAALIESNASWGIDARRDVEAWASGARLYIAGQQVGVAGGPLYTLSKIATLIRMKRDAEARGERAVAFFWLATEDHDFDEVAQLSIPAAIATDARRANVQRDLITLGAAERNDERCTVGSLAIPDSLRHSIAETLGIDLPKWLRPGITFRDSFAELIAETFGSEVVLVDSLLPALRRAGAPLFALLSSRMDEAQGAVASRTAALQEAGYAPQITAREGEGFTFFFEVGEDGARTAIATTDGISPEHVSTSAMTRPLLQDFVLQPDAFVGGPAEVAYYAQVAALHELAGVRLPHVALRGHALLIDHRTTRAMHRLGVTAADCFRSADDLIAPAEGERISEVRVTVAEAEAELMRRIEQLRSLAVPADRGLAKSIERSVRHLEYHFRKLGERSTRAVIRNDRERWEAARRAVAMLYPDGRVQERVVSWYAFVTTFGNSIVDSMIDCVGPDRAECALVSIM